MSNYKMHKMRPKDKTSKIGEHATLLQIDSQIENWNVSTTSRLLFLIKNVLHLECSQIIMF